MKLWLDYGVIVMVTCVCDVNVWAFWAYSASVAIMCNHNRHSVGNTQGNSVSVMVIFIHDLSVLLLVSAR